MSYNIGAEEQPFLVFVNVTGGMVDAIVRAPDEATFLAAAEIAGLRYEITVTTTDPETGETTTTGTGDYAWAKGVHVDPLGPVVLTPGTYDEDGTELTPPVVDNRFHANFRLSEPAVSRTNPDGSLKWHGWAYEWTVNGSPDVQANADEEGRTLLGVTLIDPATINSPSRVWL